MTIGKIREIYISQKCIDDVGDEDAKNLLEIVITTRGLGSEISSALPDNKQCFIDMKDNLLAEIGEMADKHGIDKMTFRDNCLSATEYFSGKEYGE